MLYDTRHCPSCGKHSSRLKYKVDDFRIVSCKECGFVYLDNPLGLADEPQNYEAYFNSAILDEYGPDSHDNNIKQAWLINEQRLDLIRTFNRGGKLLDVGCGRGFFLHHARQYGFKVRGLEISRLAARFASENYDLRIHICNLDEEMPPEERFDLVTMWHVLEHFQNPRSALEKIYAMLRPGGRLFIEVPNLRSLKFQLSPAAKKWRGGNHPKYHRSFFTRETLAALLNAAGFSSPKALHIAYATSANRSMRVLKKMLNFVYRDSFLDITAIKSQLDKA